MNSRPDIGADLASFNLVKIGGPRLPSGLIERRGLNDSFAALRRARLGCVRAPAGSGKTSLLLQWRSRLVAEGAQVVWLSLDAEDNDPWSFFRYLGLALLRCGLPAALALNQGYEVPAHAIGAQSQVAEILDALSREEDEIFVFIDDFHHIANDQILHALAALLQGAPANLHLVLASAPCPSCRWPSCAPPTKWSRSIMPRCASAPRSARNSIIRAIIRGRAGRIWRASPC